MWNIVRILFRLSIVAFILSFVLLASSCGSGSGLANPNPSPTPDPLVGDWKSTDFYVQMYFHVDAPDFGSDTYVVTWTNGTNDPNGVMNFAAERVSTGEYRGVLGDDSVFRMVGDRIVKVTYTDADFMRQTVNFEKTGP